MKSHERDAIIKYLEFRLVGLVDSISDDVDSISKQRLILEAHDILTDIEDSFIIQEILNSGSSTERR